MREERKVVARNKGLLVPVPATVRKHLRLYPKLRVYWHTANQGMALLTTSGKPTGGRRRLDAKCDDCVAYQREIVRLEAKLRAAPVKAWNLYRSQEVGRQVHLDLKGYPAVDAINDRLREIERALVELASTRRPGRRRLGGVVLPPGVVAVDVPPGDGGEPAEPAPASHAAAELDPPYADDFDGNGRLIPRSSTRHPRSDLPSTS